MSPMYPNPPAAETLLLSLGCLSGWCPLNNDGECMADDSAERRPATDWPTDGTPPKWCPLRRGAVVVRLAEDDNATQR